MPAPVLVPDRPPFERLVDWTRGRSRTVAARTATAWRHSLQLRVGVATVLVTSVVAILIGVFLIDQVSGGILRAKKDAAIKQAKVGLQVATNAFSGVDSGVYANVATAQDNLVQTLNPNSASGLFTLVIKSPNTDAVGPGGPSVPSIPSGLRKLVQKQNLAVQYAKVPESSASTKQVPGLIVGEAVPARSGYFELYYVFPLTSEEQAISLVQQTVLLSGLALVILVLGIALLITRLVVQPVRVAAGTAGRLANGDLSQRIAVKGTDDLARLGNAFNDMAGSLQSQIRRLEELSRLQRRFTSDVSHELRTPLTTIRMATELLHASRADFSPTLARSSELLRHELDRFESLLADLLEISRYDAGANRLDSEPGDLRAVIATAVQGSQLLVDHHGSEIRVTAPETPVIVDMDARRVERILRNLLGNALDHGEGRPVEVTLAADADAAAITVRDHGVGLRAGEAGLVFNRFWRGDPSRSRLTGGTGLGLAISLEDARLHDGWLQAWGERGRGAQFRLTLPRQAGHTLLHSPLPLSPDDTDDTDGYAENADDDYTHHTNGHHTNVRASDRHPFVRVGDSTAQRRERRP